MAPDPRPDRRAALRAGLTAALRARDAGARDALRTALAAIENAEAVEAVPVGHDGPTEVARRALGDAEVAGVVRAEIGRLEEAAAQLVGLGRTDRAEELRRQAAVLRPYA